jgi:hypothetical protein
VVDETIWHGHLADGHPLLLKRQERPDRPSAALHFQSPRRKISREQVWCDLALVQQNLGCTII